MPIYLTTTDVSPSAIVEAASDAAAAQEWSPVWRLDTPSLTAVAIDRAASLLPVPELTDQQREVIADHLEAEARDGRCACGA